MTLHPCFQREGEMTTAQQPENKVQQARTVAELVDYIQALTTEIQELYCLDEIPWVLGVSWGKRF